MRFSFSSRWKQRLYVLHVSWVTHVDRCCSPDEAWEYVVIWSFWYRIESCEYQSSSSGTCWCLPPASLLSSATSWKKSLMFQGEGSVSVIRQKKKSSQKCTNPFLVPSLQQMLWSHPSQDWVRGDEKCGNKEVTLLSQTILTVPEHSPHVCAFFFFLRKLF